MKAGLGVLVALLLWAPGRGSAHESRNAPERLAPSSLRATEGTLRPQSNGRLRVEVPKVRAVASGPTGPVTELRFTYLGPTERQKPLASGELRRQLGLKLRARDGCNVVYVMWRLAPKPGIVVSLKRNPGEHSFDDCGNGGYSTVHPARQTQVPRLRPGDARVLRAELEGEWLRVRVDGACVWEGKLPSAAFSFDGPPGVRTDNARLEMQFLTSTDD